MSALTDRIAEVLQAELDEHGCEDDDEKRWQVARHWAERVEAELQLTPEWTAVIDDDVVGGTIVADESTDSYEHAQEWVKERCKSCDHCRNAQPKFIAVRFVSAWSEVES